MRSSAPGGYDSGLADSINSRVWVHEFNESANMLPAPLGNPPLVQAMIDLPQVSGAAGRWGKARGAGGLPAG